jgi:hypothetical protein
LGILLSLNLAADLTSDDFFDDGSAAKTWP